jgi:hypothetical protein
LSRFVLEFAATNEVALALRLLDDEQRRVSAQIQNSETQIRYGSAPALAPR